MLARSFVRTPGADGAAATAKLRVMQWNVLADGLAAKSPDNGAFAAISSAELSFDRRKGMYLEEVEEHSPDIICLQEVDHFDDFFYPELRKRGYHSIFAQKSPSVCSKFSDRRDGVAIFVKRATLDVECSESFQYTALESGSATSISQPQVAIIVIARMNDQPVLIATTHLKATKDSGGEAIRAGQANQLLARIQQIQLSQGISSVIIAGDFNATAVHQYYEPLTYCAMTSHGYRSVYDEYYAGRADWWTTWKIRIKNGQPSEVKHSIDYIFLSPDLQGIGLLTVPADEDVPDGRLPAATYPSDHLSLVADIALPAQHA